MKHKRILFVDTNHSIKGGGQISLLELVRSLNNYKLKLFAICGGTGELKMRLDHNGARTQVITFPSVKTMNLLSIAKCLYRIISIIQSQKINVIHSNDTRAHFYCGIAAKLTGIPSVFHYRVSYTDGIWDKLLPLFATKVISASNSIKTKFPGLPTVKQAVIYNAVDTQKFKRVQPGLRKELKIKSNAFVVGTVGRLNPEKGIDRFIKVIGKLSVDLPNCYAIIAGAGELYYKEFLRGLCKDLDIEDKVFFVDSLKDIPQYYSSLDAYCLFSVNEGFNRSIIEAMACKCPVVAANVGGNPEAIRDKDTGYLISPEDLDYAAEKLKLLAGDSAKRKNMGTRAREVILEFFTLEKQAGYVNDLYESLC